jgi:hypothetical protein
MQVSKGPQRVPLLVTDTKRGIFAQNPLHLQKLRSGESSSVTAESAVAHEYSESFHHQPLTWVDRKGKTGAAPPLSLDNPYMTVEDYDKWTNVCENGK